MQNSFHFSRDQLQTLREHHLADAMEWLMRLQDEPESPALTQQHSEWLADSPEHQSAWEHACHTWRLLQVLPPVGAIAAVPAPEPVPDVALAAPVSASVIPISRWAKRVRKMAVMAAAACVLLVSFPTMQIYFQADYSTGTGQTRHITLSDGSQVYLGADSAIAADLGDKERRISLLKGEAFFDVVPNQNRPFVVNTDNMKVTVLGTSFNVALDKVSESVSVASGKVSVENQNTAHNPAFSQQLLPGEQLRLADTGAVTLVSLAIEDVGSWRDKRLYVQDVAIADVAATLQRYHSAQILILGGEMAAERVTGAYDLSTPDRALESLVSPYQGKVYSISNLLRVVTQ